MRTPIKRVVYNLPEDLKHQQLGHSATPPTQRIFFYHPESGCSCDQPPKRKRRESLRTTLLSHCFCLVPSLNLASQFDRKATNIQLITYQFFITNYYVNYFPRERWIRRHGNNDLPSELHEKLPWCYSAHKIATTLPQLFASCSIV